MIALFFIILILISLIWFLFYHLWYCPIQIQRILHSQGLKGPSYKFIHGNSQQILKMRQDALTTPAELSQHNMFPRIIPHINTWIKLYGNNFLHWNGRRPQLVVTEIELVKEIMTNKEGVYEKLKPSGLVKIRLGDGLVVAQGKKWSKLRKIANYAFHGEYLKDMVPAMIASVNTMLQKWENHVAQEIEVTKEFKLLTSEVISRTAFGSSYVEGQNIFQMMSNLGVLIARNMNRIRVFGPWMSREVIEANRIAQSLRGTILSIIRKREDMVKQGVAEDYGNDFLGLLLKVHHNKDDNTKITIDNIVDECKVFYVAGHETTSTTLSWIALMLSIHTEWQEKAREEVMEMFGSERPTGDGIGRLKIVPMIVNETLRLYSPVVNLTRRVTKKTQLGKYEIPGGVEVSIPPLALHMNEDIWGKDAHTFNPERFSGGLGKATNGNPAAFLPFSYGPRVCVGFNFAANETKIALSMILQRYRLELSPNYVHSPFQHLTINPKYGIPIILRSL